MSNTNVETKKVNAPNLIRGSKSINLIPPLTQEEIVVETSKVKLNVGAAVSLFILISFSLLIVGFNIFAKIDLNRQKDLLFQAENDLSLRENLLTSNDEILRRINLYTKIATSTYSSRDIITYLQSLSSGLASIDSFELTEGSSFDITGSANNLTDVSKLWYVLGNDRFIESVNLKTVVKDIGGARFNFEGKLNVEEFKKEAQNG
ncbi:hypothetical protein IT417_02340 [bacterium]|nr:hypothetical protein [bacterium]